MTSYQGMQDLRGWPAVVDSGRRVASTSCGQRPQVCTSGGLRPSATWQNQRQKKKAKAEHPAVHLTAFDYRAVVNKADERTVQRPAVKLTGQLGKTRTIWYNGDIKKNPRANRFDLNIINLYLNYNQTEGLLTSGADELNDKQGKNKKKKSKWLCNNLGSRQREVPRFVKPTATRSLRLTPSKTF